jgi:dTMP kinase
VLIAFEGIDGAGKSTACDELHKALVRQGHPVQLVRWLSFLRRPNEATSLADAATPASARPPLGPLSYALRHCAEFAFVWETVMAPALGEGKIVLTDRYKYSALVRDVIRGVPAKYVETLYSFASEPDLLLYLDLDPALALERKQRNSLPLGVYEVGADLFGALAPEHGFVALQSLCRRQYAAVLPGERTIKIPGGRSPAEVNQHVLEHAVRLLQRR